MCRTLICLVIVVIAGAALFVCDGTTGEQRVVFDVSIVGVGGFESFDNEPPEGEPWTVSLEEARVAIGPVYLFEGDPLLASLYHWLVMPRAFAHPGHYQEGEALGEALDQRVVDLLDPNPTILGPMNAVTGQCNSAQVGLGTAEAGLEGAELLEGHALLLRGTATRGGDDVPFEAWLDDDLYVEGVAFEHDIDTSSGGLRVQVDLTRWLGRVDFSSLTVVDDLAVFEEGTQAHNALTRGVDNTLAYRLSWIEGG